MRLRLLSPLLALLLGGCVVGMATSAVGMAAEAAAGPKVQQPSKFMQDAAKRACSTRAAEYGAVQRADVKKAPGDEITVLGTVQGSGGIQAFECRFVTTVVGFELKPVQARGE